MVCSLRAIPLFIVPAVGVRGTRQAEKSNCAKHKLSAELDRRNQPGGKAGIQRSTPQSRMWL